MHDMFNAFLDELLLTAAYNEVMAVYVAPSNALLDTIAAELLAACVLIVARLIMLFVALV